MAVIQISNDTFQEFIQSPEPVLVDFFATWCGPCKMLAPVLDEIAEETGVSIGKVDVDEAQDIAMEYGIMSVPTLMVFQNGQPIQTAMGAQPKAEILKMLGK